jgi:hypothetical protein
MEIRNWWLTPHSVLLGEIADRVGPLKCEVLGRDTVRLSPENWEFLFVSLDEHHAPVSWGAVEAYGKTKATAARELYRKIFISPKVRMIKSAIRPPECVVEARALAGLTTEAM